MFRFRADILADSISPKGIRLTTYELTYPRIIHGEVMTHREFSRNAMSSRAIPSARLIKKVWTEPYVPASFGANKSGMQAGDALSGWRAFAARMVWTLAMMFAVLFCTLLNKLGVHKQWANRLIEPFQWYTIILTATEFSNFFALRRHPDAQPEIQALANLMWDARQASIPARLDYGQWHRPLLPDLKELIQAGYGVNLLNLISIGRCARVSYLTHDGVRDPEKDIALAERLLADGHMSPFEHVATPSKSVTKCGNFKGWIQHRKQIPYEADFGSRPTTLF